MSKYNKPNLTDKNDLSGPQNPTQPVRKPGEDMSDEEAKRVNGYAGFDSVEEQRKAEEAK